MFERVINQVITDRIADLDQHQEALKTLMFSPGWEDAEMDKILTFWNDDGKPNVIHGYARAGAKLPCYSIILNRESPETFAMGDGYGINYVDAAAAEYVTELESELGRPVDAGYQRWEHTYQVYVWAQNPDVCLAYYTLLRNILLGAKNVFRKACGEEPKFSGADLMPDPRYLPDNVFTRQLTVTLMGQMLFVEDLDLGPLGTGRATSITGIHINNRVIGVVPCVNPIDPSED